VVPFHFTTVVPADKADATLEERIRTLELPNFVERCLRAYRDLRADGGSTRIFWAICPRSLKDAQEDAMAQGNMVYRFLTAGPDESATRTMRTYVVQRQGAITEWVDLKKAFDAYVRYKHPGVKWTLKTDETGVFTKLGYEVARDNMCKSCGGPAIAGCCPAYSGANRVKRIRIHHMALIREFIQYDVGLNGFADPLGDA
jgi:hypothetical protein